MPRVHHVKKAMKDNRVCKKGESYYWWKFRYGGKQYSKTYPRASQLTQSDKLGRIYSAQEAVQDSGQPPTDARDYDTPEALATVLREVYDVWETAVSELNEVGDEYDESADNKEEYFPGTGDEIREKAEAVRASAEEAETQAGEFESAADELDGYGSQFQSWTYTLQCGDDECGHDEEGEVEDEDDIPDECPECGGTDVSVDSDSKLSDEWYDEAQMLLDNLPSELEVELY